MSNENYSIMIMILLCLSITKLLPCFSSKFKEPYKIEAIDSDFFLVFKANSSLPVKGIGDGIFAKRLIPKLSVVCEYRGPVAASKDNNRYQYDKSFATTALDNNKYTILGNTMCAYINDCTSAMHKSFTLNEWNELNNSSTGREPTCYDGFKYNVKAVMSVGGKIFYVATSDIAAGQEIFVPYSWGYWKHLVHIIKDGKIYKHVNPTGDRYELQEVADVAKPSTTISPPKATKTYPKPSPKTREFPISSPKMTKTDPISPHKVAQLDPISSSKVAKRVNIVKYYA